MSLKDKLDKLTKAIERFGEVDVSGLKLDEPDERLLLLDQLDIMTHVIIQAPAVAYYNYQFNRADAELRACKEDYEKWLKVKKLEAEAQLVSRMQAQEDGKQYKPTEHMKEARVYVNSREKAKETGVDEAEEWINRIRLLESYRDALKFWVDGFNAKNFLINGYASRYNSENTAVEEIRDPTPVERPLSSLKRSEYGREYRRE